MADEIIERSFGFILPATFPEPSIVLVPSVRYSMCDELT